MQQLMSFVYFPLWVNRQPLLLSTLGGPIFFFAKKLVSHIGTRCGPSLATLRICFGTQNLIPDSGTRILYQNLVPRQISNKSAFLHLFGPWKNWPEMTPNGARRLCFLLIQTLPTFWAARIWILRLFIFLDFPDPKFPDFQVPDFQISRLPDFQISRFPDSQISKFPDPHISRFTAFQPSRRRRRRTNSQIPAWPPMHPGIKYVTRSPCCDYGYAVSRDQSTHIEPYGRISYKVQWFVTNWRFAKPDIWTSSFQRMGP